MCDRWRGCENDREYIEQWVKYRKSNRKLKHMYRHIPNYIEDLFSDDNLMKHNNNYYHQHNHHQMMAREIYRHKVIFLMNGCLVKHLTRSADFFG